MALYTCSSMSGSKSWSEYRLITVDHLINLIIWLPYPLFNKHRSQSFSRKPITSWATVSVIYRNPSFYRTCPPFVPLRLRRKHSTVIEGWLRRACKGLIDNYRVSLSLPCSSKVTDTVSNTTDYHWQSMQIEWLLATCDIYTITPYYRNRYRTLNYSSTLSYRTVGLCWSVLSMMTAYERVKAASTWLNGSSLALNHASQILFVIIVTKNI